ncbi:MAG: rhodanese-like domain-containing protein [Gammaproteobacteria bacterium]
MRRYTAAELKQRLSAPGAPILLDIREHWERAICSIEPSLHIPMRAVPTALDQLDRTQEVVVYCHHGIRSQPVTRYLEDQGYRVADLAGGIDAWTRDVDPSLESY